MVGRINAQPQMASSLARAVIFCFFMLPPVRNIPAPHLAEPVRRGGTSQSDQELQQSVSFLCSVLPSLFRPCCPQGLQHLSCMCLKIFQRSILQEVENYS